MENSTFSASDYEKEQIDAIKKILRVHFGGNIELSKSSSSLKPSTDNENLKKASNELDDRITRDDLIRYVNDINMIAHSDENKLCFMYDANREFTIEKRTVLESYPPGKNYGFRLDKRVNKCNNTPHNSSSDLQSATYSSMFGVCCEKIGIPAVRICGGDFDWTDDHAMEKLNEIVSNIRKGDFC